MGFQGDSIYWVEVEKVVPNPFQPRREFDQAKLQELSESIRMYGVMQPLTVTRHEVQRDDGTFYTEYELIAGERRLRASKLAGIAQVPVIIRDGEESEQEKLELAIIENLQREDLNAVDRALAFKQLAEQFSLSHVQVAKKVGRSREYVSNSIRLLALPEHMLESLKRAEMSEGHARTLLMLNDRPEEQEVIFKEILLKKMSVREVERIVRKIATDKVRKKNPGEFDAHLIEIEKRFTETLGTRVQIMKTEFGGKLTIDYFSQEDLEALLERVKTENAQVAKEQSAHDVVENIVDATPLETVASEAPEEVSQPQNAQQHMPVNTEDQAVPEVTQQVAEPEEPEQVTQTPKPLSLEQIRSHFPNARREQSHFPAAAPEPTPTAQVQEVPENNPPTSEVMQHTPAPEQVAQEPQNSQEEDTDLYSIKNFTV